MKMIGKILGFGRRQLHTIISREIIKPSTPTPSHLQTYNLSQLDQCLPNIFQPLILFYPNNGICSLTPDDKARVLKTSLSQSLTRYYPFAGTLHTPTMPYIDCNDVGVVFVEARNDSQLDKFQHINEKENTAAFQLFSDGMVWQNPPHSTSLVGVQVNHFACGGMAVAVSMSHRIGDGATLGSFVNHLASVARYGSTDHKEVLPLNPHFIQSPATSYLLPDTSALIQKCAHPVTRKFVFPNSKVNDLKNTVLSLRETGSTLATNDLTRVEVLTSLLYKTAVAAATPKSGAFKPYYLFIPMDVRKKFVPKLPQTTVGNFVALMKVKTRHTSENSLNVVVSEIKKEKMKLEGFPSVGAVITNFESCLSQLGNEDLENVAKRSFWCSSLCGFPYNKVDFGWAKPTSAALILASADRIGCILMDTPNGDGIEARVTLEEQDMEIFQNDKELLSFCH